MSDKRMKMRQRRQAFRRLHGEKKAVSPVVATLILILIAVAAAAALYLWLVAWQGGVTKGIGSPGAQYTVTIGGSTSVYPFDEVAVTQFEQNNSDVVISDNQGGTGAGMIAVCTGQVDIGTASTAETVAGLQTSDGCPATTQIQIFAYDAVDVIVPVANPHGLQNISYDTLTAVYDGATIGTGAAPASLQAPSIDGVSLATLYAAGATSFLSGTSPNDVNAALVWEDIPACVNGALVCGGSSNPTESNDPAQAVPQAGSAVATNSVTAWTAAVSVLGGGSCGAIGALSAPVFNPTGTSTGTASALAITGESCATDTETVDYSFTWTATSAGTMAGTLGFSFAGSWTGETSPVTPAAGTFTAPTTATGSASVTAPAGIGYNAATFALTGLTEAGVTFTTPSATATYSGGTGGTFAVSYSTTYSGINVPLPTVAISWAYTEPYQIAVLSSAGGPCPTSGSADICATGSPTLSSPCGFTVCAGGTGAGTHAGQDSAPIRTVARTEASGTTQTFEARLLDAISSTKFASSPSAIAFTGCGGNNYISDCGMVATETGQGNPNVISTVAGDLDSIGYASDGLARLSSSGVSCQGVPTAACGIGLESVGQTASIQPSLGSTGTIAIGALVGGFGPAGQTTTKTWASAYGGTRPFEYVTTNTPTGEVLRFINFVMDPANNINIASESAEVSYYSV